MSLKIQRERKLLQIRNNLTSKMIIQLLFRNSLDNRVKKKKNSEFGIRNNLYYEDITHLKRG